MERMNWEDMQRKFPDEWLLIIDYELDESGHLLSGIVNRHSKEKHQVYSLPSLNCPTAFRYTGKSTFAGLRSHANDHSL